MFYVLRTLSASLWKGLGAEPFAVEEFPKGFMYREWTDNGPIMHRHWTDNHPRKTAGEIEN